MCFNRWASGKPIVRLMTLAMLILSPRYDMCGETWLVFSNRIKAYWYVNTITGCICVTLTGAQKVAFMFAVKW